MPARRWRAPVHGALVVWMLGAIALPAQSGATLVKGDLVVADADSFGGGGLIQVDPETGAESVLSSNEMALNASQQLFARPYTLAVSSTGRIYVANSTNLGGSCSAGCGGVVEVNPSTGAESVLSSNAMPINASSEYFDELTGIAVNPEGNIIVTSWNEELEEGDVIEVNSENGKETLISSNTMPVNASSRYFTYPQGLVADAAGEIFVADAFAFGGHGGVIAVDPATGKETEISSNEMSVNASSQFFRAASQLVFNSASNLVVASWCQASKSCSSLIEVNIATGKEALISSNEMAVNASSQLFKEITAVAVQGSGRIIGIQENGLGGSCNLGEGCGGLVYVDPETGKESELSGNGLPVNASSQLYIEPFDVIEYGATPWPGPGSMQGGAQQEGQSPGSAGHTGGTEQASGQSTPSLGAVRESHHRWRERAGHRAAKARRAPRGTVFSFTLSQAATVELTFSAQHARASSAGCSKSRRAARRPACSPWRAAGTLTIAAHAGINRVAFAGRLSRTHVLRPGRYQLKASLINALASAGGLNALYFTIVR